MQKSGFLVESAGKRVLARNTGPSSAGKARAIRSFTNNHHHRIHPTLDCPGPDPTMEKEAAEQSILPPPMSPLLTATEAHPSHVHLTGQFPAELAEGRSLIHSDLESISAP